MYGKRAHYNNGMTLRSWQHDGKCDWGCINIRHRLPPRRFLKAGHEAREVAFCGLPVWRNSYIIVSLRKDRIVHGENQNSATRLESVIVWSSKSVGTETINHRKGTFSKFTVRVCADEIYTSTERPLAESVALFEEKFSRLVSRGMGSHTLEPLIWKVLNSTPGKRDENYSSKKKMPELTHI